MFDFSPSLASHSRGSKNMKLEEVRAENLSYFISVRRIEGDFQIPFPFH